MAEEESQYEMCDSRPDFTLSNETDVGKNHLDRNNTYVSAQLGYENPAFHNASSHIYESPSSSVATMQEEAQRSGPKQRARINQVYEGFDSDEGLNKTMIFEAIRNIDHHDPDERKKQCQLGCFSVLLLTVLLLISLTASAYIFYKMEINQSSRCGCDTKVQAVFGENTGQKNKTEKTILQSKQIRQLQENVKFLENRFNKIKMNNSLNSRNYRAHNLKEINNVFDKKFLAFSKNLTSMKDQLSEIKTLVNNRKLEIKLNRMNNTINYEVATMKNKIAGKESFRNCTLETKKETNVFQQADFGTASVDESANHKIIGVTCASTMEGKTQHSYLVIKKDRKITYKCECTKIGTVQGKSSECIIYYWQCPNN